MTLHFPVTTLLQLENRFLDEIHNNVFYLDYNYVKFVQ